MKTKILILFLCLTQLFQLLIASEPQKTIQRQSTTYKAETSTLAPRSIIRKNKSKNLENQKQLKRNIFRTSLKWIKIGAIAAVVGALLIYGLAHLYMYLNTTELERASNNVTFQTQLLEDKEQEEFKALMTMLNLGREKPLTEEDQKKISDYIDENIEKDIYDTQTTQDFQYLEQILLQNDLKALVTIVDILDGETDYPKEWKGKAIKILNAYLRANWKAKDFTLEYARAPMYRLLKKIQENPGKYHQSQLAHELFKTYTEFQIYSENEMETIKALLIQSIQTYEVYEEPWYELWSIFYRNQHIKIVEEKRIEIFKHFNELPKEEDLVFKLLSVINSTRMGWAPPDDTPEGKYYYSPEILPMAEQAALNKEGQYKERQQYMGIAYLLRINRGTSKVVEKYFTLSDEEIQALSEGQFKFYIEIIKRSSNTYYNGRVDEKTKKELTRYLQQYINGLDFTKDQDKLLSLMNTLAGQNSELLREIPQFQQIYETKLKTALDSLPQEINQENFLEFKGVFQSYKRYVVLFQDDLDYIYQRFGPYVLDIELFNDEFFKRCKTADDYAFVIDFITFMYIDQIQIPGIHLILEEETKAQQKEFVQDAIEQMIRLKKKDPAKEVDKTENLEKLKKFYKEFYNFIIRNQAKGSMSISTIENMRKKLNLYAPSYGDQMMVFINASYIKEYLNEDSLSQDQLDQQIQFAEDYYNFDAGPDVSTLYQLVANFRFSKITSYINKNQEKIKETQGEDKLLEYSEKLGKYGFFLDIEVSDLRKLAKHISGNNFQYLWFKAQTELEKDLDIDLKREDYTVNTSKKYQLEEGFTVQEIREKSNSKEVLAYLVKGDMKKGMRFELSADVGRVLGGVTGESLSREIGSKGRLILDFPISFTTGNAKPTEIVIEDGKLKNFLISPKGKDGMVIVYKDKTIHLADKKNLWLKEIDPTIDSTENKRLDITRNLEDYITFVEYAQKSRITVVSNMLLYNQGKEIARLQDGSSQRRLLCEFQDGTYGLLNPMKPMSTYEATQLAILFGAKKAIYCDTGQFDYTTFRPFGGKAIVWGHSDQPNSSNRGGFYYQVPQEKSNTSPIDKAA